MPGFSDCLGAVSYIHGIRSEVVQQGAESQAVPPRRGEVGDLHPAVVLGDLATPGQQGLAGVGLASQHWTGNGTGLERAERRGHNRKGGRDVSFTTRGGVHI